jgi:hypothetical protein
MERTKFTVGINDVTRRNAPWGSSHASDAFGTARKRERERHREEEGLCAITNDE